MVYDTLSLNTNQGNFYIALSYDDDLLFVVLLAHIFY